MNKKIYRLKRFFLHGIIFTLLLSLLIFTTCRLEGDIEAKRPKPPVLPDNKTLIVFDNTQGICAVSVYEDYRRREDDKIVEVSAGKNSATVEWTPGDSVPFYFSYAVTLKDVSGFTLNYVPEIGKDQKTVRIDTDKTTTIKVPTLSETFSSSDTLLSNNSYLFIQNNSSYSFELHQGTSKIKPDNISSSLVNNGEIAQYTINPGPASNYRLLEGADYKDFSGSIVNFEAGHIYIFDYNGSISLVRDTELKLENIKGFGIPQSPTAPVVITSNGTITLQWTAVESATAYEIWMATVNDSASATKYGADVVASLSTTISGLNNGTAYYFWLKAKNILGTSGFSPVAAGIPSASTVKPPDPQTAPSITTGNEQLTVSWQAVAEASVYEVWVGTSNNAQTATKQSGDVSGLSTVITSMNNGTSYYIWIKAKNNIGVSGFSPSATGKPIGTPGAPTISSGFEQLLVTWTAVAGAEQYEVYYGIESPTTLAITTTGTTATITGLTKGTAYYVRLRAKNSNGISDYGPSASGVPNKNLSVGLYRGSQKIGNQNLTDSLTYISSNAVTGDNFYIVLGADESVSPKTLTYGKTVGITLLGSGVERTLTLNANGSMFTVNSSVTLTLDENITIFGRSTNNSPLITVSGGYLIINDGAIITGNTNSNNQGSGVRMNSGNITMNGGKIYGNILSMNGVGGGVYVGGGSFTMNGGEISGNTVGSGSGGSGGGVYIEGGIFILNNGKISKNNASSGGGVYVSGYNNGYIIMNGGKISGNTSSSFGGGVGINSNGNFVMYGGVINGNSASSGGGVGFGSTVNNNFGNFKKLPPVGDLQDSGIIYGSEAIGVDADGFFLKNESSYGSAISDSSGSIKRNTTVWETDQIDSITGKGLSANGNPPFGQ